MFEQVISIVLQLLTAVTGWMLQLYNAIPGSLAYFMGFFVVFLSYRFLLAPLVRGDGLRHVGASDRASRSLPAGHSDRSA